MKTTEKNSLYSDLEKMSPLELLKNMNTEGQKVAIAVKEAIPAIESLVKGIVERGGRIFYIGAVRKAREIGMLTGCVACNENSPLGEECDIPVVAVVGPEFVTCSSPTRNLSTGAHAW